MMDSNGTQKRPSNYIPLRLHLPQSDIVMCKSGINMWVRTLRFSYFYKGVVG